MRSTAPRDALPFLAAARRVLGVLSVVCVAEAGLGQAAPFVASPVPAGAGWRADRIHRSDGGVWYAHVDKVIDAFGQNEVIAGDDKGRLLVLAVYSGQWTAHSVVCDGLWLAPTRSADVDPRVPGREIYAAGRAGSVHRVTLRPQPFARFTLESVEIGHAAGEEFHAVIADDLVPGGQAELLAFGISGAVYELAPTGTSDQFAMRKVGAVPGRVRDVAVARGSTAGPLLYGVSRSGDLLAMRMDQGALQHEVMLREDSGLGRIALAKGRPGVLYVTRDDGVVLRIERTSEGRWQRDAIFAGGQGLRGVASGRFFADDREAVAVYGYDKTVHVVWRQGQGPWQVETALTTEQRGHWLAVGELDGRNGTDELVVAGFDGDVFLLSRPPGHGLPGAAVAKAEQNGGAMLRSPDGLRVAARFGPRAVSELSSLRYQGGFETKAMVFETLVRRGPDGRIAPGLATSWQREDDGRAFVFTLRPGAAWHDGRPVAAGDVAVHFRRWVGLPEHGWLRSNARIAAVRAIGDAKLRIDLDRPAALLADLCAINPTAVMGPGSWTREGEFAGPVGSGPFRLLAAADGDRTLRYAPVTGRGSVELVAVDGDPVDGLLRGEVDAVVSGWLVAVDPLRAAALRCDSRYVVVDGPGSSMWHLHLRWHDGPLADLARRRAVAAAVDRAELVRVVAAGYGDPGTGWAAPSIIDWPQGRMVAGAGASFPQPLRLDAGNADPLLVATLVGQFERAGIRVELAPAEGVWDLRLERSHGVPYDPFTIVERFGRKVGMPTAASPQVGPVDAALADAIDALVAASDEATWPEHYARIQQRLDELLPVVPLFAPRRLAIVRAGIQAPALDHDLYRLDPAWLRAAR